MRKRALTSVEIAVFLTSVLLCNHLALANDTTASFGKYEDEGSSFCSIDFVRGNDTGFEIIDYWSEHGPQLMALIHKDGSSWMKIVDIDHAKVEISIIFSDGFRLESSALIDEYSGRPFITITPDFFFRLLTKPSWTVQVNQEDVLSYNGPKLSNLESEFLKCVSDWKS